MLFSEELTMPIAAAAPACRSSSTTHRFVHWNNQGANMLENRQFDKAATCFTKSIKALHEMVKIAKKSNAKSQLEFQDLRRFISVEEPLAPTRHADKTSQGIMPVAEQPENKNEKDTTLYQHPVRFHPGLSKLHSALSASARTIKALSVLVIFNAAVATQSAGRRLDKAAYLYESTLSAASQRMCFQPLRMSGLRLVMASYYNLAQAHAALGDAPKSKLRLEALLSLLLWSVTQGVAHGRDARRYWSAVHPLLRGSGPAAAA